MADYQAHRETQSTWSKYKDMIPITTKCFAIVLMVLNIIWPGLGAAFMACLEPKFLKVNLIIALLQFVLTFIIIGWIWSIIWGVFCLMKSKDPEN